MKEFIRSISIGFIGGSIALCCVANEMWFNAIGVVVATIALGFLRND